MNSEENAPATSMTAVTGEVVTPQEVTAQDVVKLADQTATENQNGHKARKNKLHQFDYEDPDTGEVFHLVAVYPGVRAARKLLADSKNQLGVLDSEEYAKHLLTLIVAPKTPKIDFDFFDQHGGYNTIVNEIDQFFSAQLN